MGKKRWSRQPVSSIRQSRMWIAVIIAAFVLILIRFIGIYFIQSEYAFYDIAKSSTQGTVEDSQETTSPCYSSGCTPTTSCSATVSFTPSNQSTSFTTTDNLCGALAQGTTVEVLYDPQDPSIAKTVRQAFADVAFAIAVTIVLSVFVLIIIINMIRNIYYKKQDKPKYFLKKY